MQSRALTARAAAPVQIASSVPGRCGGGDSPALRSSVDALKASVIDLRNRDVRQSGLSELQDDVAQMSSDLDTVKTHAEQLHCRSGPKVAIHDLTWG